MSTKAREATGIKSLKVIADRGYYDMEVIKATVDEGIIPYVPKSLTSSNRKKVCMIVATLSILKLMTSIDVQ